MKPFSLTRATNSADAIRRYTEAAMTPEDQTVAYCAGGTTLVDLMKLGVMQPAHVIDILDLRTHLAGVTVDDTGLQIGALSTMNEVANHPEVTRHAPAVSQALRLSASTQLRNVATIGGNLLQRTRCSYFRDPASHCNKRIRGSGCAAIGGKTRELAVLGTSSDCIANYSGDLAIALTALGATITVLGISGRSRDLAVEDLHRAPGDRPDIDTMLEPGDLITAIHVPHQGFTNSVYLKIRDRASYAFAVASAAVAIKLERGRVEEVGLALGGLATKPWRCHAAEQFLRGKMLEAPVTRRAAQLCFEEADCDPERAFKVELGQRTVERALGNAANQNS